MSWDSNSIPINIEFHKVGLSCTLDEILCSKPHVKLKYQVNRQKNIYPKPVRGNSKKPLTIDIRKIITSVKIIRQNKISAVKILQKTMHRRVRDTIFFYQKNCLEQFTTSVWILNIHSIEIEKYRRMTLKTFAWNKWVL